MFGLGWGFGIYGWFSVCLYDGCQLEIGLHFRNHVLDAGYGLGIGPVSLESFSVYWDWAEVGHVFWKRVCVCLLCFRSWTFLLETALCVMRIGHLLEIFFCSDGKRCSNNWCWQGPMFSIILPHTFLPLRLVLGWGLDIYFGSFNNSCNNGNDNTNDTNTYCSDANVYRKSTNLIVVLVMLIPVTAFVNYECVPPVPLAAYKTRCSGVAAKLSTAGFEPVAPRKTALRIKLQLFLALQVWAPTSCGPKGSPTRVELKCSKWVRFNMFFAVFQDTGLKGVRLFSTHWFKPEAPGKNNY